MHEQFFRALEILENAVEFQQSQSSTGECSTNSTPKKINKRKRIERERNAYLVIRQILGGWESLNNNSTNVVGQQIQRRDLSRAIGALFKLLDHREQALRFVADQTLDAIFRKFILKFHAQKVIEFLLNEMNKKEASARSLCAALQKLTFVIGHMKAQRASIYISYFLSAICQFLQRPEDSIQICVDRQFPPILSQIGPFISAVHTEKVVDLFEIAIGQLELSGPKNRAASTVIGQLTKIVPPILHKSFYQLSRIILDGDERRKGRIAGALNSFCRIWPIVLENLSEISAQTLQKLLSRVICCLFSNCNKILVASLEFLQKCASPNSHFKLAKELGQFKPLWLQKLETCREYSFGSPIDSNEGREIRSKSSEDKFGEMMETMSVLSMQTGNSSKMMSAWNSLDNLVAINQIFDDSVGDEENVESHNWAEVKEDDGRNSQQTQNELEEDDDGEEEEDDKYSVISEQIDEIFVDPLMNCFHQQQKDVEAVHPAEESCLMKSRRIRGTLAGGSITPNSARSRQGGRHGTTGEISEMILPTLGEENDGRILEHLPTQFCNFDANFWTYSALIVAKKFLLADGPNGGIRSDGEVRISHKILALDYIGAVSTIQNDLQQEQIFDENGHPHSLSELFTLVSHEDDNLAISALNLAFNFANSPSKNGPSSIFADDKNKLIWLLKKSIHSQNRNPNRIKGILQIFANSLPLLYGNDQLFEIALEIAFRAVDFDYFLVKKIRADFFAQIYWSIVSEKSRQKMQSVCLNAFLQQIFDSDPRVQKGTLDVLGLFVRNADFGRKTNLFTSISLPQCMEECRQNKIPLLLGLDPSHYSFYVCHQSPKKRILSENLCQILQRLYKIALEKFSERQSKFFAALLVLIENFPPKSGEFFLIWLTAFNDGSTSNFGKTIPMMSKATNLPKGQNLLTLLLECAEGISNLDELTVILRLISAIFSAISEELTINRLFRHQQNAKIGNSIPRLWGFPMHNIEDPTTWANPIEHCLLLYLRILNFFYSIMAEEQLQKMREKQHDSKNKMTTVLAGAGEKIGSRVATILSTPLNLLPNATKTNENENQHTKIPSNSAKATNLSLLIGTGVKQFRQTSFTHSLALKTLEPILRGAYRSFLECLDLNVHRRFLDPFEASINGFCAFLEMADLAFIRPFLDELLIYLRVMMDISSPNSARLFHQLLKCLFNSNAQNLTDKIFDPNCGIFDPHSNGIDTDPIEFYFISPLNSFIFFSTFVSKSEFMDTFSRNIGGWIIHRNHQQSTIIEPQKQEQINKLLHQFEPFINHLLKLYPIINSVETRKSVLECISSLCLCKVRYELLDRNGKFQSRIVGQLKQFCAMEDAQLLPSIFAFLCVLARNQFIKFSEIENFLAELFAHLSDQFCSFAIEAAKIVLLDVISFEERKTKQPEVHKRICIRIKEILCQGFAISFQLFPESSAQLWILLLNEMRQFHIQIWSECCEEFFDNFSQFWLLNPSHWHQSTSPNSSTNFEESQFVDIFAPPFPSSNPIRLIFLHTILLFQCSLTIPINLLINSIQQIFDKLADKKTEQILNCENEFLANIGLRICPFLFVLTTQIEEESLEARIIEKDEQNNEKYTFLQFLASNFASFLAKLVNKISENANKVATNPMEGICLFFLFTIQKSIKSAGKSPKFVDLFKINLANETKLFGQINTNLAKNSPKIWAFWSKLTFDLQICQNICDFLTISDHCKFLLIEIFVDKICECKNEEEIEKIIKIMNLNEIMGDWRGDEFLINLMKIGNEKQFKKCIAKLDEKSIDHLKAKGMQIFRQNRTNLDGLLHRFFIILSKFEKDTADYSEFLKKIVAEFEQGDGQKSAEIGQIFEAFLNQKKIFTNILQSNSKFSAKEFSEFGRQNLSDREFYGILASHASSQNEFKQICKGIMDLDLGNCELATILDSRQHWPIRREFYLQLFSIFMENTKMEFDRKGSENYYFEFGKNLIQTLVENILLKFDKNILAEEKIFVMAKIGNLMEYLPEYEFPENLILDGEIVERMLNWPFVRILLERAIGEGKELPMEYFRALKLFFILNPVKMHFCQNDCHTLTNLLPFLTTLWEQIEKQIPRWHRLQIDKMHWPVQIIGGEGEAEEEIHKMFALVQRIIFAIQSNLIEDEPIKDAFQAILSGIYILQKMALVPEKALRSDWKLSIEIDSMHQKINIPLIQIRILNVPSILQDFCWRYLWLGWSSRAQFEEFCMSLYGVLSSTPTNANEIRHRAELEGNGAVNEQLLASSLAIDALCAILLQTILYPQPGNPVCSKFVIKYRKRQENYHLFLDTDYGKLAKRSKSLTKGLINGNFDWPLNVKAIFTENLECTEEEECGTHYGIGQTSLYYLWSMSGLLESIAFKSNTPKGSPAKMSSDFRASISEYLIAQSTELDTASSLRALFETFIHWLRSAEQCQLPIPILHSTLRSLALISDLFHDSALFKQTFASIKPLMAASQEEYYNNNPTVKGYCLFILLKCAAVLDWKELADNGEIATAKFIESLVQNGLNNGQSEFVRICTLNGLLYILQSLNIENLQKILANSFEFVLKEIQRMQQKLMTDILTECPINSIKYQKLCWALCFALLQEAIPIEAQIMENFLQLVKQSFVDPRLPRWLKLVLTQGIESLVLHSSTYSPGFRRMALECFETYQLQPAHLPFSISIYSTCAYRELQEGGEFAYSFNKTSNEDFQKLLNIFSFYSNSMCHSKTLAIVELLSDLVVSTIWAKEAILSCLWTLLIPPPTSPNVPKVKSNMQIPRKKPSEGLLEICAEFEHPLQPSINNQQQQCQTTTIGNKRPKLIPTKLELGQFDQAILHLMHLILKKLFANDRRVCLELTLQFVIPKLKNMENGEMAKCLALMMLCSANSEKKGLKRIHFLFNSNPFCSNFFKAAFPGHFIRNLIDSFIFQIDSMKLANSLQIDELKKFLDSLIL